MWNRKSMALAVLGQPYEPPARRFYRDELSAELTISRRDRREAETGQAQRSAADEWLACINRLSRYSKRRH